PCCDEGTNDLNNQRDNKRLDRHPAHTIWLNTGKHKRTFFHHPHPFVHFALGGVGVIAESVGKNIHPARRRIMANSSCHFRLVRKLLKAMLVPWEHHPGKNSPDKNNNTADHGSFEMIFLHTRNPCLVSESIKLMYNVYLIIM